MGTYDLRLVALSFVVAVAASYTALDLAGRVTASRDRTRALWLAGGATAMGLGIWSMHFVAMLAFRLPMPMPYHVPTVLLSLLVAVAASGLALLTASRRTLSVLRLLIGGALMGLGVASMHYVGMAGMRTHAAIRYDPALVALSVLIAIGASLAALKIAFQLRGGGGTNRHRLMIPAALAMGVAISGMHYTGMAATRFVATGHPPAPPSLGADTSVLGGAAIAAGTLVVLAFALLTALVDRRMAAQVAEAAAFRRSEERLRREVAERGRAEELLRESEERYRLATRATNEAIWDWDMATGSLTWGQGIRTLFGYSDEEVEPTLDWWGRLIHPDDGDMVSATLDAAIRAGEDTWSGEYRFRRADGSYAHVADRGYIVRDDVGCAVRMIGSVQDITDRRRAQEAMRESEERFRILFEHSPDGVLLMDPHDPEVPWRIIECNDTACRMNGYARAELIGQSVRVLHSETVESRTFDEHLQRLRIVPDKVDLEHRRKDGTLFFVEAVSSLIRVGGREMVLGIERDITERKAFEEQLRYHAFHDSLTGLPNRALLLDRLEHAVVRAARRGHCVAVLYVDLDRFKFVNDSLGHDGGDRVLVETSRRLRACVRPEDTAARLGGDEFAVLLEEVEGEGEAKRAAERIEEALGKAVEVGGREVVITCSVGIAVGQGDGAGLLRDADIAMYRAKLAGKARYAVFDPGMGSEVRDLLELEADLRRALERDELVLHYQPKVELATGGVVGMEALVRWEHPTRGTMPPGDFIHLAEETGLILPIGRWILLEACRQTQAWREGCGLDRELDVCVNVSARQFGHPELVSEVAAALETTGLAPRALLLEITESTVMADAGSNVATLNELKALGVRLAVDDFGTGYSSLSYLRRFPVDFLKIDRSFVDGLGQESDDTAIVRSVISLAHSLRLEVIAEGVESADQAERLRALGCRYGQGYHFSRPLTAEAMGALLRCPAPRRPPSRRARGRRPAR